MKTQGSRRNFSFCTLQKCHIPPAKCHTNQWRSDGISDTIKTTTQKGAIANGNATSRMFEENLYHSLWRVSGAGTFGRFVFRRNGRICGNQGESGSGKTTLLNILAALDQPTSGKVFLDGKDLTMVKEREIAAFRRDNLGFVFQDFNLLDTFSLKDNIFLPLVLAGKSPKEMELRLNPIADQLALRTCWRNTPMKFPAVRNSVQRLQEH